MKLMMNIWLAFENLEETSVRVMQQAGHTARGSYAEQLSQWILIRFRPKLFLCYDLQCSEEQKWCRNCRHDLVSTAANSGLAQMEARAAGFIRVNGRYVKSDFYHH
jgi:hypothetical protein